ncbi:hypothetical protein H4N64_33890 [Streptomyces sp. PSKA01]|uniref:Uncharacterized protein n=1 Tax=Streptomyces cupreus TaxID=2759956 RepID=A0A7X1MCH2_9ACTN|nr:hypothetical protein [Streptomyces cupreus]
MAEHRFDQITQLARCLHRAALAVRHRLSLDGAWSVVRVLDCSPAGGGDEQGGAEGVDIGFLRRLGFARGEHAARDLGCLVVDEAAAEREVVSLGYVSASGKGEVDQMGPLWPDDEVGGLHVTVCPALGVEFSQCLNAFQRHTAVRCDGRALFTTGLPQPVQVGPFVPRLEVPRSALPLAVRDLIAAEAVQDCTLAGGRERGTGLGGPVGERLLWDQRFPWNLIS